MHAPSRSLHREVGVVWRGKISFLRRSTRMTIRSRKEHEHAHGGAMLMEPWNLSASDIDVVTQHAVNCSSQPKSRQSWSCMCAFPVNTSHRTEDRRRGLVKRARERLNIHNGIAASLHSYQRNTVGVVVVSMRLHCFSLLTLLHPRHTLESMTDSGSCRFGFWRSPTDPRSVQRPRWQCHDPTACSEQIS